MKQSFKDYVVLQENGIYALKKNAREIPGKYDADFIESLSFSALNRDFKCLDELQNELGNDTLLFLYNNPGRDCGEYYFHNQYKEYITEDYIKYLRNAFQYFENIGYREAWFEIYCDEMLGPHSKSFIEYFKNYYSYKEYVNLTLAYSI